MKKIRNMSIMELRFLITYIDRICTLIDGLDIIYQVDNTKPKLLNLRSFAQSRLRAKTGMIFA